MNPNLLGENIFGGFNYGSPKSKSFSDVLNLPQEGSKSLSNFNLVLLVGLTFFVCFFVTNLMVLQIFNGSSNLALSVGNSIRMLPLKAERGLIVGAGGRALAGNGPSFDLYFDPASCPKGCPLDLLKNYKFYTPDAAKTLEGASEMVVVRDISQEEALDLSGKLGNIPYLQIKAGQKRDYKEPETFFHLLGYVSQVSGDDLKLRPFLKISDKVGRMGVEKTYDDYLRGQDGGQLYEADALGRLIRKVREVSPVAGNTVVLNIDEALQEVSFTALSEGVKKSKALSGAVVASDPGTGKILAIVSLPSVNSNLFSSALGGLEYSKMEKDPGKPFFNRAISGAFPPGSVFKMVVASGALMQKTVTEKTLIEGPGSLSIGNFSYKDWKPNGHGSLTISDAIKESCDTCFYTVGGGYGAQKGLGQEQIARYSRLFGFGSLLGLDLPGESGGLVPDAFWKKQNKKESWYVGDTYHYAIGQGFLQVTPLQINSMTAVIANGGTLYEPFVVSQIKDARGYLVRSFTPTVIRSNFVDKKYLDVIKEGMTNALKSGGTAFPFYDFNSGGLGPAAGKTGTAETGKGSTHAWFTVFTPVENPKIALTVFLEEGGEGSYDAAPIARKILDAYFKSR